MVGGSYQRIASGLWVGLLCLSILLPFQRGEAYYHQTSRIHYYEYSQEPFHLAQKENKPIFMLITAVWCYWCKYFREKALETQEVSEYLNAHYISIFVDSDRRLDLTNKYLAFGWPTVVLFDPQGKKKLGFAGALNKKTLLSLLKEKREEMLVAKLKEPSPVPATIEASSEKPTQVRLGKKTFMELLEDLERYLDENFDEDYGGFGDRKKYPMGRTLSFLLERYEKTGNRRTFEMVKKSLDTMLDGLYDPVEGGFHRYSASSDWKSPHYEKMTYVNAGLIEAYLMAYRVMSDLRYKKIADKTINYVLKNLYDGEKGGFYGSQKADKSYYHLSQQERNRVKKPFIDQNKYTPWNSQMIIAMLHAAEVAKRDELKVAALKSLMFLQDKLSSRQGTYLYFDERQQRPFLWGQLEANAWASLALLQGYKATNKKPYLDSAEKILQYSLENLFDKSRGAFISWNNPDNRIYRAGEGISQETLLESNGVMGYSLLAAYRITGKKQYLQAAKRSIGYFSGEVKRALNNSIEEADVTILEKSVYFFRAYELLLLELQKGSKGKR